MKSNSRLLVLVLSLIALSRITPSVLSNNVFSTDTWPLIRLAEKLVENPSVGVFSLDTHHAKWPLSTIMSLVYTGICGVDVISFYKYIGVLIPVFSLTLLFYLLLGLTSSGLPRSLGLLALLVYPSYTVFTSAYLKEVYAYPLLLVYLYLVLSRRERSVWAVLLITAIALSLSHPLASLMALASTSTLLYIWIVERARFGPGSSVDYRGMVLSILLLGATYILHARLVGVYYVFTIVDLLVLGAYTMVLYGLYFTIHGDERGFNTPGYLLLGVSIIAYILLVKTPVLTHTTILYALPLVILVLPVQGRRWERGFYTSILLPIAIGVLYTLTYAKWMASITHRFLNYLVYPLGFKLAYYASIKPRTVFTLLLVFLATSTIVYYSVSTGSDPLTFYWRYTMEDTSLKGFIEGYKETGVQMIGGAKYSYLLGLTLDLELARLQVSSSLRRDVLLLLDSRELVYGVPVSPIYYIYLKPDIYYCNSLVYNSLSNYVLVG